jgi:hypothetical protein
MVKECVGCPSVSAVRASLLSSLRLSGCVWYEQRAVVLERACLSCFSKLGEIPFDPVRGDDASKSRGQRGRRAADEGNGCIAAGAKGYNNMVLKSIERRRERADGRAIMLRNRKGFGLAG